MQAKVRTVAFQGIDVLPVDVQVLIAPGNLAFAMVGLADKAVGESRERVRAALRALGLALPPQRITVNLSPADLAKEGSHYDLPIALGAAGRHGRDRRARASRASWRWANWRSTARSAACRACCRRRIAAAAGGARPDLPRGRAAAKRPGAASTAAHRRATGGRDRRRAVAAGADQPPARPADPAGARGAAAPTIARAYPDLAEIKGQETAKRVLELAAAGGHNLLMIGPPGSGKSMLAARLPGLLPPLEAGRGAGSHRWCARWPANSATASSRRRRSFRDPHHSATLQALVGGGPRARPGEVSLAHHGVLFLDELPEFNRADPGGAAPAARDRPRDRGARQRPRRPIPRASSWWRR